MFPIQSDCIKISISLNFTDNASPTMDTHCCSRLEKNFQLRHHSQRSGVKTEKQTQYTSFVDCQICLNGYLSEIDLEKHLQTCHPQVFH